MDEYDAVNPLGEDDRAKLIALAEMTSFSSPGCEYGFTVENDGVIWRVIAWSNDTSVYEVRGYGATLSEALNACLNYESDADIDEIERLDKEWMERRAAIYSR